MFVLLVVPTAVLGLLGLPAAGGAVGLAAVGPVPFPIFIKPLMRLLLFPPEWELTIFDPI